MTTAPSKPTRFCILATQRTGSSWLTDLLNQQPHVRACTEVFLDRPAHATGDKLFWGKLNPNQRYYDFRVEHGCRRPWAPHRYLAQLDREAPDDAAFGFKLMYNQCRLMPELMPMLIARRYRLIHLVRDNLLDVAVSRAALNQTDTAHRRDETGTAPRLELSPEQLVRQIRVLRRKRRMVRTALTLLPTPVIEVSYESLRDDPEPVLERLLAFLRVPGAVAPTDSVFRRVNATPLSEKLANYSQVAERLRHAGFGRYLETS